MHGIEYEGSDIVRVSIVLEDESTVEKFNSTDIAENSSAIAYREDLKASQAKITTKIEAELNTNLDVAWNLTLAANLISANVRFDQIEAIENVDGVKEVVIENRYDPMVVDTDEPDDPNMSTSSEQIGSSTAWAAGYTGAGSRIAVIDTGIDIDHQSFSASGYEYSLAYQAGLNGMSVDEYKESLDLLDADEIASVLDQLNIAGKRGASADALYQNSKVPFAYNYIDENNDITHLNDTQGEHGSHVEGIAAANAFIPNANGTFSSALDTVLVQGVAPNAQIITMKVFGTGGGAYDSDYMAAIEDAIILGADSVNLSLGSGNPGFSRSKTYDYVMNSLAENGTVVTMSAGNSYNWPEYSNNGTGYLYSDDVSLQTGGSPGSFSNSLAVASVDNDGATGNYFTVSGNNVFYTETNYTNDPLTTLAGEQEYVFIDGFGDDFTGIDVAGKIVFVSRGSISFYQKAENAVNAGAIATIIYNNATGTISMDLSSYTKTAPCVSITQADGNMIRANSTPSEDGTYYTGTMTVNASLGSVSNHSDYYTMSSFSSWGVPGSLELKPEITAPGGNIYSVYGANADTGLTEHDQYELMSGTSMASPQVAGMAAVLAQYIRENDLEAKTGLTQRQLINSLLMSTAEPIMEEDSGSFYSILNQGAGLANVGNAINADSYILMDSNLSGTASDGKVKAELGDDPDRTGEYEVKFSVNNLTDEAQEYTFSTDIFTQDIFGYNGEIYLDKWTAPIAANVTYTVNGETFVPSATVDCDLDNDGNTDADEQGYAGLSLDKIVCSRCGLVISGGSPLPVLNPITRPILTPSKPTAPVVPPKDDEEIVSEPVEETVNEPVQKELPFVDVSSNDWYYTAVEYVYNEGIMNGTGDNEFSPDKELNRATIITILYRMAGEPKTTTEKSFSDVPAGEWYSDAVEWAVSVGITNGYDDGTFAPTKAVTRQELSAFIYRFAQYNGVTIYETNVKLGDNAVVSSWANESVTWAVSEGLLVDGENVNAVEFSTRAEVAAAVYTYLTKTAK